MSILAELKVKRVAKRKAMDLYRILAPFKGLESLIKHIMDMEEEGQERTAHKLLEEVKELYPSFPKASIPLPVLFIITVWHKVLSEYDYDPHIRTEDNYQIVDDVSMKVLAKYLKRMKVIAFKEYK